MPSAFDGPPTDGRLRGEIRTVPLSRIIPNEWNPNEMDATTFDRLVEELGENGMIDPLQVVEVEREGQTGWYMLLGGEHRWRAGKVLGWDVMDVLVIMDSKFQERDLQEFVTMRLNVLGGKINPAKFHEQFNRLAKRYDADKLRELMAFTDKDAWSALVANVATEVKKSLPADKAKKVDKYLSEVETVEDIGAVLNKLMKEQTSLDFGYLILSNGGKTHIYVQADDALIKKATEMLELAKEKRLQAGILMRAPIEMVIEDLKSQDINDIE